MTLAERIVEAILSPEEHGTSWAGETVYHGTGREHAGSISKRIDVNKSLGYFGYAFYVADDPKLAKSNYADFADDEPVILAFKIAPSARIADAREENEMYATFSRVSQQGRGLSDPAMPARMVAAGVDGIYDRSMGGIAIYNPKALIPLGEWTGASAAVAAPRQPSA